MWGLMLLILLGGCTTTDLCEEKKAHYAYVVGHIDDSQPRSAYHDEVASIPGSCQKVITAFLAYHHLGADFTYVTRLYADDKNIRLIFQGDPTLTSAQLEQLLEPLAGRHFDGDFILDGSWSQVPAYSLNVMREDIGTYYARPCGPFILDGNGFEAAVIPTRAGELAELRLSMMTPLHFRVMTRKEVKEPILIFWEGEQLMISGELAERDNPFEVTLSPPHMEVYLRHKIGAILKRLDIHVRGICLTRIPGEPLPLVGETRSPPLRDWLPPAFKTSDNLVFDALYVTLVQRELDVPFRDWSQGDAVFKKLLKQYAGLAMTHARLVDGSGLARYNHVRPKDLFEILRQGAKIPLFLETFAESGDKTSSLKSWPDLPLGIRAKTGHMSDICCLAGYEEKGGLFVVIASHIAGAMRDVRAVIARFVHDHL